MFPSRQPCTLYDNKRDGLIWTIFDLDCYFWCGNRYKIRCWKQNASFYHKTLHFVMKITNPMQHFVNKIGIVALSFLSCKLHMVAKVLQSHRFCEFCLQNELTHIQFGDNFIIKCNVYEQNCVRL